VLFRSEPAHEAKQPPGAAEPEVIGLAAEDLHRVRVDADRLLGRETDHLGLCRAWRLLGLVRWLECSRKADDAWEQAAEHARLAGETRERADLLAWLASSAMVGPEPASAAIRRCSAILAEVEDDRRSVSQVLQPLAVLHAMTGDLALAGDLLAEARAHVADLGITMHSAVDYGEAYVAMFAGDYVAAEAAFRHGLATLAEMGEKALLSTIASLLADPLYAQGRDAEAEEYTQLAADTAAAHDLSAQVTWRRVRAKVIARQGRFDEAEGLAREAVALADRSDWLIDQADALLDLAEVLELAGRRQGSQEAARRALVVCERKENTVGAERARARLARLARRGTITT